jgi:hypothetical protein
VRLACQFRLNVEDTLTAVRLYFNRTLNDENGDIRFLITVWDDAGGRPGNIIYQDSERRRPLFRGLNQYVQYNLEEPLVCSGTIYIGFEQTSADYINLGFDRNNDASSHVFFLTSASWQTSILRGALMLRPYFGQQALVSLDRPEDSNTKVFAESGHIVVNADQMGMVCVYDMMGREVYKSALKQAGTSLHTPSLPQGVYLVKVGKQAAKKVIVL